MLKIFRCWKVEQASMTAALEPAAEEEADNMNFVDLCEELEALEKRVMVQRLHIQQKLEDRVEHTNLGRSWKKLEVCQ
jgi:hypothetical protein